MLARFSQAKRLVACAARQSMSTLQSDGDGGSAVVTHTGQTFDKDDYRNARFVDRTKLVNKRFAIDYIAEDPVVVCDKRVVWSSGGGALGHPKVFINLDKPGVHICGYSGRKFVLKKNYNESEHGPSIAYKEYLDQMKKSPLY